MNTIPLLSGPLATAIGWFYLLTNSARIFTYVPQIIAVWRCKDGARAISLLTWVSWMVSHLAAISYGALVLHDAFFVAISTINFTGCATVSAMAARRRGLLGGNPGQARVAGPIVNEFVGGHRDHRGDAHGQTDRGFTC